ncbi:hypothetical protein LTR74_010055 [Friedmanniomyces endolithicus]|nr:hypothetical protein LTR74_010055 [Friedmanniomyces endolithicus]
MTKRTKKVGITAARGTFNPTITHDTPEHDLRIRDGRSDEMLGEFTDWFEDTVPLSASK